MSAWLGRLVRQSRVSGPSVRPPSGVLRVLPSAPESGNVPFETEAFAPAPAAFVPGDAAPRPGSRISTSLEATDSAARLPRGSPADVLPRLEALRRFGEDPVAPPRGRAPRLPTPPEDEAPRADVRRSRDADASSTERMAHVRTYGDDAVRSYIAPPAGAVRPAVPVRYAAPARGVEAAAGAAASVPDVHIHIGRVELTALTAPPVPRRERAPAAHRPMSLDEYLRRRDGGGR